MTNEDVGGVGASRLKYTIFIFGDDFVWTPTAATGASTSGTSKVFFKDFIDGKFKAILVDTTGASNTTVDYDLGIITPRKTKASFMVYQINDPSTADDKFLAIN